jgi:4-amino-4-deoxy-L-arabinose transferase-like glycosyltransferase
VRFVDFLRATVMLSAGAATALALVTVLALSTNSDEHMLPIAIGWWLIATIVGLRLGRRAETNPLPEDHPSAILVNRLWPLLLFTLVGGGLAFLAPQVPGIAAGFAIIWALAWRRQDAAVAAIEGRDGAFFYVLRTSPVRPMALERTPGFKALRPERANGAVT